MERLPSRRTILRSGAVATSALLAGCALDNPTATGGNLYVENRDSEPHTVTVVVRELAEDETLVLQNRYRVPSLHVLEFDNVLQSGTTFLIVGEQHGIDVSPARAELEVSVATCGQDDPSARMDVALVLDSSGPGVITWPCTQPYTYRERLTYVEPDDHVVRTETTSSP